MKRVLASAAVALAVGLATPAAATIVTATFTGTIISGSDDIGVFGHSINTGDSYVAQYVFDTTKGHDDPNLVYGGTSYGLDSPSVSTTITLSGRSFTFVAQINFVAQNVSQYGVGSELTYRSTGTVDGFLSNGTTPLAYTYNVFNDLASLGHSIPQKLDKSFTHVIGENDAPLSNFDVTVETIDGRSNYARGSVQLTSVSVVGTAGVPEPATWAMMITGFGLIGASIRRKRTAVGFA